MKLRVVIININFRVRGALDTKVNLKYVTPLSG
jgi:hypothetical protein